VDRAAGRVAIRTGAQALVIADALSKAGYPATAMTG
jgi:copper chaperone